MSKPKLIEREIFQKIIRDDCICDTCFRALGIPFYLNCVEIYLSYLYNFDTFTVRNEIKNIKDNYKRKKKLVILYIYCNYKFNQLYIEIKYKPNGSGYQTSLQNFYKFAALQKKSFF